MVSMKSKRLSKRKFSLLVVAHPDDETLFFAGAVLQRRNQPWKIICVTDGNADGRGQERRLEFMAACRRLGCRDATMWSYPDIYERRLNIPDLMSALRVLPTPQEVFTHGIVGEYGHPHHQDVSYAVHQVFAESCKVYSPAYNSFPELRVNLRKRDFAIKADILNSIYGEETRRFLHLLPATWAEGFVLLKRKEVENLYGFLAEKKQLNEKHLSHYRWLSSVLAARKDLPRPF